MASRPETSLAVVVLALLPVSGCSCGRGPLDEEPAIGGDLASPARDLGAVDLGPDGDLAPPDLAPPPPLTLAPASVSLLVGATQQFTSSRPASWRVVETAHAGRIDAGGFYVAPSVAGVVHVQALAADGASAEATITVTPGALAFLAGKLGGPGNADGTGGDARFDGPSGLAWDGQSTLYVGDFLNQAIRTVDVSSGQVTTPDYLRNSFIAPSDGFGWDSGALAPAIVDVYPAGRLVIAAWIKRTLVAADLSTSMLSVLSGTPYTTGTGDGPAGTALFELPVALTDDGHGMLYVLDGGSVRTVDASSGAVVTLAGDSEAAGYVDDTGTAARFYHPSSIASDHAGTLYVADYINGAVRRVDVASKVVDTIIRSPDVEAPDGVAIIDGALYVAEASCISRVDPAAKTATIIAGARQSPGEWDDTGAAARLQRPQAMTGGNGTLYFADAIGETIRSLDLQSGAVTTIAGSAVPQPWFIDPAFGRTDAHVTIQTARGLTGDGNGGYYVADAWGQAIVRVSSSGAVTTVATGLAGPTGVAFDGAGTLYIADGTSLRALNLGGGTLSTVAGMPGTPGSAEGTGTVARFNALQYIAYDNGFVYGSDVTSYVVRRIDVKSGAAIFFAGSGTQASVDAVGKSAAFENPEGITSDGNGTLYVADTLDAPGLRRIDIASAAVSTVAVTPNASDGRFHFGAGTVALASDGQGRVYVGALGGVQVIDVVTGGVDQLAGVAGQLGVLPGPLPARLSSPMGIALTGDGLAITDEDAVLTINGR